jgi:monovalent cation/proton antiporter MnhG/PhaG subunit
MDQHPIVIGCLLGVAVALCLACAIGLLTAGNPYDRLQFCSPVASVAVLLIVIAVWINDPAWQARVKSALIGVVLFAMNSILSHATARAIRIRDAGHWEPEPDEKIPGADGNGISGETRP